MVRDIADIKIMKKLIVQLCILSWSLLFILRPAVAESDSPQERPNISGPSSVNSQISRDRSTKGHALSEIDALKPWFAWKDSLASKYGFTFATDYIPLGFKASDSLSGADDSTVGGAWRLYGNWVLFDREGDTQGELVWRTTYTHSPDELSPVDFSLNGVGNVSVFAPLHDDNKWKLANLYWHQDWMNGEVQLNAGFMDVADLMEFYSLTDPLTAFQNLQFLTGIGTVPLPSAGSLGIIGAAWLSEQVYFSAGVLDSNGDATDPFEGFDTIGDKEFFRFAEIGWTPSRDLMYSDNVHLTIWQVDEREDANTKDGWGAIFSYSRYLDGLSGKLLPFFKAGYAEDGSSLLAKSVSFGAGYQPWHDKGLGSLIGVGLNWGEPNPEVFGSGLNDQYAAEIFFRWQFSRELAVTPNIHYFKDPALNPDEDTLWMIGLRLRMAL